MAAQLLEALILLFYLRNLLFMVFGTLIGMLVGVVPGINATIAVAMLLPLSYGLSPETAIIFLVGIYVGAMQGGAIPAILLNVPGTGAASATALDGYPLALKGRAGEAIAAAVIASFIGNCITFAALLFLAPPLAAFSLNFGPAEFFAISIFGVTLIGAIAGKDIIKGLIAGLTGLLIGTIGVVPFAGTVRYTGGIMGLYDGVNLQWGIVGFFAIAQSLQLVKIKGTLVDPIQVTQYSIKKVIRFIMNMKFVTILSAAIGVLVGMTPGPGAATASWITYAEAKKHLEGRDEVPFGEGRLESVVAVECANNATVGGALIPTLVFGIPGSPTAAVMLGAFVITGLSPGFDLFQTRAVEVYSIILSIFFAGCVFLVAGLLIIPYASKIVTLKTSVIVPAIVVLGAVGGFIPTNTVFGIYMAMIIGGIGYILNKHGFPSPPLLLGLILATITEQNFHRLFLVSGGGMGFWRFIGNRPIAAVILILCVLSVVGICRQQMIKSK